MTLPLIASLTSRLVQLVALATLSTLSDGHSQLLILAGFGLISAIGVLSDSGGANYLLVSARSNRLARRDLVRVASLHLAAGSVGLAIFAAILTCQAGDNFGSAALVILGALAATQLIDSTLRTIRAPILVEGNDALYAVPELTIAVGKLAILAIAAVSTKLLVVALLPIPSALILLVLTRRVLKKTDSGPKQLGKGWMTEILTYGASGAASAAYSQAPVLIGSAVLPLSDLAVLAVIYRLIQPMEVVPATVSQQLLPRMAQNKVRNRLPVWIAFLSAGVTLAAVLILGLPLVEHLLAFELSPIALFYVALVSVPIKFGNYYLAAVSMSQKLVRQRLIATVAVGFAAVTLAVLAGKTLGALGIVVTSVASEGLLAFLLFVVGGLPRRRLADCAKCAAAKAV